MAFVSSSAADFYGVLLPVKTEHDIPGDSPIGLFRSIKIKILQCQYYLGQQLRSSDVHFTSNFSHFKKIFITHFQNGNSD
ncbi:MAG: hypothetical protein ACJAUL_001744 [Paraglaciecola sp.]|jgi:hypothetical protein